MKFGLDLAEAEAEAEADEGLQLERPRVLYIDANCARVLHYDVTITPSRPLC
jgi:hypothetical protein